MSQSHKVDVLQVKLNLSTLSIDDRLALAAVLAQMAPKSGIYAADPTVKDAADNALKSGAEFAAAALEVRNAQMKLASARSALAASEVQHDRHVLCLKSVAESRCESEKELNDLGFNRRPPKALPGPLLPPETITFKAGKEKGSMVVQARRVGQIASYGAEISADPVGPGTWQAIPGTGSRRTLSGCVSGAHYWVRFRSVRASEESAWSDPVVVVAR